MSANVGKCRPSETMQTSRRELSRNQQARIGGARIGRAGSYLP